jgi:predicted small metal-binding protein
VLTGQDEEELFRRVRRHVHEDHPEPAMTGGRIRDLIAAEAVDA